jgi:hypothetical protein
VPELSWQPFQEGQVDRLAEEVRRSLDLANIRGLVGLE